MDFDAITQLISSVGFPIACTVFMGFFIYKFSNTVMTYNKEREDKLYEMIGRLQGELDKLEDSLSDYVTVLGKLRDDVNVIKEDIRGLKE